MDKIVRITSVLIVNGDNRRRVKIDAELHMEAIEALRKFAKTICMADNILFNFEEHEDDTI